jgi:CDP-diacylglycerol---serine O-phosphatidyltransferase
MAEPIPQPSDPAAEPKIKIYFLPNLLTAGNLFCGFVALTKIVEAGPLSSVLEEPERLAQFYLQIQWALGFILLACIFDLFDGRVARMGGVESPFGREFDSLADLISFGAAPAFLIHRVVLSGMFGEHSEWGWFIASIYLICGAFRLARFNCLAAMQAGGSKDFLGFPIPSAAGLVSSLTLLIIQFNRNDKPLNTPGRWLLVAVLLFLSAMMVSTVKYPSFKSLGLRSRTTLTKALMFALFIGLLVVLRDKILIYVLPAGFTLYLIYGFIRPSISRKMRRDIEDEDEDEEEGAT